MGHEIEDVGNGHEVFFAGTPFWHGLGTVVEDAPDAVGALKVARLDWTVAKRGLWANGPLGQAPEVGEGIMIRDRVAIVREDLGRVLGVVSAEYAPIQNAELAALMDEALSDAGLTGQVRFESAGALRGGQSVFFLARLGELAIGRQADVVRAYALGLTSHDGTRGLTFFPTGVRVGCANTLRLAEQTAGVRVSFNHIGRLRDRLPAVVAAWRRCVLGVGEFEKRAQKLASVEVTGAFAEVFGKVVAGLVEAIVAGKGEEVEKRRREESARILRHFHGDGTPGNGQGTTVWDAYQAADYWLEHEARRFKTATSRFESVVTGEVSALKAGAFADLVEAVG